MLLAAGFTLAYLVMTIVACGATSPAAVGGAIAAATEDARAALDALVAAYPDAKYISKEQFNHLVTMAEQACIDLDRLKGSAVRAPRMRPLQPKKE